MEYTYSPCHCEFVTVWRVNCELYECVCAREQSTYFLNSFIQLSLVRLTHLYAPAAFYIIVIQIKIVMIQLILSFSYGCQLTADENSEMIVSVYLII